MRYEGVDIAAGYAEARRRTAAVSLVMSLSVIGCGGRDALRIERSEGTGSIRTTVALTARSGGPTINQVQIEVEPAGVFQLLALDSGTGFFTGVVVVPTGVQAVTASAFSGMQLVGTGTGNVVVARNGTSSVFIKVLDNSTPPVAQDHGPIITSISATPSNVATGDTVNLHVSAIDPDGDTIQYQWTQDCSGVYSDTTSATTTWSDSYPEYCVLTATATARGIADSAATEILVAAPSADIAVSASFIPRPYVRSVGMVGTGMSCTIPRDALDASCRPAIAPGTVLSATVTFDPMPDDSGATVALTDGCGGSTAVTTVSLAGGTASFNWTAPAGPASCLITAAVTREGLSDAEQVAVAVRS